MCSKMNICYLDGIIQCEMDTNCQNCQKEEEQWVQNYLGEQNGADRCVIIPTLSTLSNN